MELKLKKPKLNINRNHSIFIVDGPRAMQSVIQVGFLLTENFCLLTKIKLKYLVIKKFWFHFISVHLFGYFG